MGLAWMAWTWPTAVFFVVIAGCLAAMTVWELKRPGGNPRRGVLGLTTTRGDRLFISLLGTAYICLAWLLLIGTPIWGALALAAVAAVLVFRYV